VLVGSHCAGTVYMYRYVYVFGVRRSKGWLLRETAKRDQRPISNQWNDVSQ
jgi:hypothetical protein